MPSMNEDHLAISRCGDLANESGPTCSSGQSPDHRIARSPNRKQYWRSLDDLADTPEFREFVYREFPAGATEMLDTADRRQFLKIMGASMALAGMGIAGSGCRRWPEQKIAPYAYRPPGHNPGSTNQFATCMEIGGVAAGLLVTSYDYRPIKIEGNPEHPINQGATDVYMQASILDLYDPDRSQHILHKGQQSDWQTFTAWAKDQVAGLRNARGNGLAILSEATSSPSVQALKQNLLAALPNAQWHEYEPLHNDNVVKGATLAFGSPHRTHYAFDKASVIVALDCDFLHCGPASIKWTRDFVSGRRLLGTKTMNRLYAFESTPTLTGANADHRLAMRSGDVALIAARIAAAVAQHAGGALQQAASAAPADVDPARLTQALEHLVHDLQASRGSSIVIAGPSQPAEVHFLAHLINQELGNVGQTVFYTPIDATPHLESIQALAQNMRDGNVQTLVILGGNPVYNAPADLNFADLLKNISDSVHLSEYVDETSQLCTWHINRAHYLETWGDGRAYDGTYSIAQPLIDPLFEGKSTIEVLAAFTGDELTSGHDIVRRTLQSQGSGMDFESFWRKALHDGFIANTATQPANVQVNAQNVGQVAKMLAARPSTGEIEIVFTPSLAVYDGRFANNGWLQELPDAMTKLTWDNAVLMSPSAAASRGLKTGDLVTLRVNNLEITAPALPLPGQFAGSVALALGYGRGFSGRICTDAGFNFYSIRSTAGMDIAGGTLTTASGFYTLAITQDHHAIDTVGGRGIQERLPTLFREATLGEYQEHPNFAQHRTHVVHRLSLWQEDLPFHHDGARAQYAWAMAIDLNACTGCSACVIACQAENNIPIVGKEQVRKNREMHWIRVDRYFKGYNEEEPESVMLAPVPCMHCENAPCEQVCPVAATTHDEDGLNVMVYNRCVGTRYCSNNCPYKVRRFNYFDYHRREPHRESPGLLLQVEPDYYTKGQATPDPLKQLQFNPEVTVRMRGIMEKCTFCTQRITNARIKAKNEFVRARNLDPDAPLDVRIPIPDGLITPACAQACPAQAIVFGDLHDPSSRVAQLQKNERAYDMLEELNTKPRTRYLAKVRNPAFGHEGETHAHG